MNPKIKALEQQCWSHRVDGVLVDGHLHFDTAKFAELIIQECAHVAVFKDSGTVATAAVAGHMAAGRSIAAKLIKEHFGVEE